MPSLAEILEAKRRAKAKEQMQTAQALAEPKMAKAEPEPEPEPLEEPEPAKPAEPSKFAQNLADKLRGMAQEQDWLDVEQSANSLSEILSVILDLPYCPDVFISECIDHAACALEHQKNQYLQDVLNGKKQSGKKAKNVPSVTTVASLDTLSDDDFFILGA